MPDGPCRQRRRRACPACRLRHGCAGAGGQTEHDAGAAPASQAPPLQETFQAGAARLQRRRATSWRPASFGDVVHYYPLDDLAGTSQFYLGEIAYQQQDYNEAINDYNAVLEGFSGNAKAPAAQLHKGYALLAHGQEAGRHPASCAC